jgi:hypothetical protein
MNKTEHYTRKARKYAIMAISGLLEDTRDFPNKEYTTKIEGYDLDCYENTISKVYKRGKQVRVITQPEFLPQVELDSPINDLSDATILLILEDMIR